MSKRNILICGITGFIGHNIAKQFLNLPNAELFSTYHQSVPPLEFKQDKRIKLIHADLTKPKDVERAIKGMDVVIQAAATTSGAKDIVNRPYIHVTDNAVMNSLILRACFDHHVKQVLFFSCTTMYPELPNPVCETDFNGSIIDKYFGVGWTKVYIEKMCEFFSRISHTKFTVVRHSNIYGPHDKFDLERSHVFGATVTKVLTAPGNELVVWGDGSEERDLLYIDDLVNFVKSALEKQKTPFELVNVGLGKSISVKDLVQKIIDQSGRSLKIKYDTSKPTIPYKLAINIDHAKKVFGWEPRISIDEGIRRTLAWHREHIGGTVPSPSVR